MSLFFSFSTNEYGASQVFRLLSVKASLQDSKEKITFYFLGAWEKEVGGIKSKEEFIQYLDANLNKLNKSNKLD